MSWSTCKHFRENMSSCGKKENNSHLFLIRVKNEWKPTCQGKKAAKARECILLCLCV